MIHYVLDEVNYTQDRATSQWSGQIQIVFSLVNADGSLQAPVEYTQSIGPSSDIEAAQVAFNAARVAISDADLENQVASLPAYVPPAPYNPLSSTATSTGG